MDLSEPPWQNECERERRESGQQEKGEQNPLQLLIRHMANAGKVQKCHANPVSHFLPHTTPPQSWKNDCCNLGHNEIPCRETLGCTEGVRFMWAAE